jgi:hypothetical protein
MSCFDSSKLSSSSGLSSISFLFNKMSWAQPMDEGIIQTLKLRYRRRQLKKTIMKMNTNKTLNGSDLLKQISVLDAIYWISNSWNQS